MIAATVAGGMGARGGTEDQGLVEEEILEDVTPTTRAGGSPISTSVMDPYGARGSSGGPGIGSAGFLPDSLRNPSGPVFALGLLLLIAAPVLLGVAYASPVYELAWQNGDRPTTGVATTDSDLWGEFYLSHIDFGGDGFSSSETLEDDAAIGAVLEKLRWTTGAALVLLALSAMTVLLHRLGAMTTGGPAPALAVSGLITLGTGLYAFTSGIVSAVRIDWVPGVVNPTPAFFTINADGSGFHALDMLPGIGYWLLVAGAACAAIGALVLFLGAALDAVDRSLPPEA